MSEGTILNNMRTKLLKRLRNNGRNCITIHSTTKTGGVMTGMSIGMDSDDYSGLFSFGDTEDEVKEKASKIYMRLNHEWYSKQYAKYTSRSRRARGKKPRKQKA